MAGGTHSSLPLLACKAISRLCFGISSVYLQALSRESKVQACLRADAHSHALLKQYVFIQEMLASLVIQQTRQ